MVGNTAKRSNIVIGDAKIPELRPADLRSAEEVTDVIADCKLVEPSFTIALGDSELYTARYIEHTEGSRVC